MSGAKTTKMNRAAATAKKGAAPGACGCGCQNSSAGSCSCGQTVCFERPNYFGGQLLSDADLSADQAYFREKSRLYHRALDGHGIVCGLRLTCDPDCCGRIRVGEGFAIDNCGNDIVVCRPATFDVIEALREKNWLIVDPPADPCAKEEPPRCRVKQCFYVTICYEETPDAFSTPFQTSCGPATAPCQPTRIKESYRFDLLEHPPKCPSPLEDLEERITSCWKFLGDSQLARSLQATFSGEWDPVTRKDYCAIFCQLQVLFKRHLKACPDRYDCTLFEQVCQLECPKEGEIPWERAEEAFCKLFQLIVQSVIDCVMGELIFGCPSPEEMCCVGLGTIEVEDGKLLRVCNCPRTYVWTFAHFFEVFLATVVGGVACARGTKQKDKQDEDHNHQEPRPGKHPEHEMSGCCASFLVNCKWFPKLLSRLPEMGRQASTAPLQTIREVALALRKGFDFTDPTAFSARIFENLSVKDAEELLKTLAPDNPNPLLRVAEGQNPETPDLFTALSGKRLVRPGDGLSLRLKDDKITSAVPQSGIVGLSIQQAEFDGRIKAAEDRAAATQAALDALTKQHQDKDKELQELKELVEAIQKKVKLK